MEYHWYEDYWAMPRKSALSTPKHCDSSEKPTKPPSSSHKSHSPIPTPPQPSANVHFCAKPKDSPKTPYKTHKPPPPSIPPTPAQTTSSPG